MRPVCRAPGKAGDRDMVTAPSAAVLQHPTAPQRAPPRCRAPRIMRWPGRPGRAQLLYRAILSPLDGAENWFKKLQTGLKGAPGPIDLHPSQGCAPQKADCRKNKIPQNL